jgi:hypothetical protein
VVALSLGLQDTIVTLVVTEKIQLKNTAMLESRVLVGMLIA